MLQRGTQKNSVHSGETIGIWKRRFAFLSQKIRMRFTRTCKIILATGVLHNIARGRNLPDFEGFDVDMDQPPLEPYNNGHDGNAVRQNLVENYFG